MSKRNSSLRHRCGIHSGLRKNGKTCGGNLWSIGKGYLNDDYAWCSKCKSTVSLQRGKNT